MQLKIIFSYFSEPSWNSSVSFERGQSGIYLSFLIEFLKISLIILHINLNLSY